MNIAPGRYTIEQVAHLTGMSVRNIRAHQTRGILHRPVRLGRTSSYDDSHVRRLDTIRTLQEQGFNLVAIEAFLAGTDAYDGVGSLLHRVGAANPRLVEALSRHGVVRRTSDGSVRPAQYRVLQSVLDLHRAGVPAAVSLQLLVEALDRGRPLAGRAEPA